jgi:hypothetical protein
MSLLVKLDVFVLAAVSSSTSDEAGETTSSSCVGAGLRRLGRSFRVDCLLDTVEQSVNDNLAERKAVKPHAQ